MMNTPQKWPFIEFDMPGLEVPTQVPMKGIKSTILNYKSTEPLDNGYWTCQYLGTVPTHSYVNGVSLQYTNTPR